jgi:hypothetical protein
MTAEGCVEEVPWTSVAWSPELPRCTRCGAPVEWNANQEQWTHTPTVSASQPVVSPQNPRSEHVRQFQLSHEDKSAGQRMCLTVSPLRGSQGETDPHGGTLL